MKVLVLFFVSLVCGVCLCDIPASERAALVDFFEQCNGKEWLHKANWMEGDPCLQQWFGVTCSNDSANVVKIDLNPKLAFNDLRCEIPSSIGNLTQLQEVYLSNAIFPSHLHGRIPDSIGRLKQLRCFYVSHGDLSGPIPAALGTLPVLQGLFLRHNELSGDLPDLSGAQNLHHFWFDSQAVTGNITWMEKLTNINILRMEDNQLSGAIPENICSLGSHCSAEGNDLTCSGGSSKCCDVDCSNESSGSLQKARKKAQHGKEMWEEEQRSMLAARKKNHLRYICHQTWA